MAQATYGSRKKKKYYPKRIAAAALIIGFLIILVTAEPANADGTYEGARYKYYTSVYVEQGDSLWSIAKRFTLPLDQVGEVHSGQPLVLRL